MMYRSYNLTRKKIERKKKLIELNKSWIRKQYEKINWKIKLSIIFLMMTLFILNSNGYHNYFNLHYIRCLVLDKIELPRNNDKKILFILKDPKNRIIELSDSNVNYEINKYYNINLSESMIEYKVFKDVLYIIIPVLLFWSATALFIYSFVKKLLN
jgi:hypothetical protein